MLPSIPTLGGAKQLCLLFYISCGYTVLFGTLISALALHHRLPGPSQARLYLQDQAPVLSNPKAPVLPDFLHALEVLQQEYFLTGRGIWPTSIDWTAAVLGTHVAASLTTLSASYAALESDKENENLINNYFSQLLGVYFGQDVWGIMQQAYDDMLWVVLEWLETIKFINAHSALHYTDPSLAEKRAWYGTQYIPAFAHRSRIFWDLASRGWDTALCGGGMVWAPGPPPYKNAITNELYITASISMYLYFPGDDNTSPFSYHTPDLGEDELPGKPNNSKYLDAAIEGYDWLKHSHMINGQGLYTDGFHISGWTGDNDTGTVCDQRDEMVYTYNQGVLLSGLRGLYESTGARNYLEDAHKLVASVIRATGWHSRHLTASYLPTDLPLGRWHGLGRSGTLEEACDAAGECSQDGQNFKGIFFHHLALLCAPLASHIKHPQGDRPTNHHDMVWHNASCSRYTPWIQHNAKAALTTKDEDGKLGMWWGAPGDVDVDTFHAKVVLPHGVIDHRNPRINSQNDGMKGNRRIEKDGSSGVQAQDTHAGRTDLNDRGRGRTVETHGGGVAVLRAAWESSQRS